jgi:hypothetical protein
MPEVYIRGNTLKYLRVPEEVVEKVKEEAPRRGACAAARLPAAVVAVMTLFLPQITASPPGDQQHMSRWARQRTSSNTISSFAL